MADLTLAALRPNPPKLTGHSNYRTWAKQAIVVLSLVVVGVGLPSVRMPLVHSLVVVGAGGGEGLSGH